MGYREIIEANRRSHQGTFMDRSWRDNPEYNGTKVLMNDDLTFWQKFTNGAYTYQAMSARFINNFEKQRTKVTFVENMVKQKSEFTAEEDILLIKRTELAIGRKVNMFRAPFIAISATICTVAFMNSKLSFAKRVAPFFIFAPLVTFYNYNIGMYGVHREIDDILRLMAGDQGLEPADGDCRVR